jgi:drug/metabolite transporter (DMT)-like permease
VVEELRTRGLLAKVLFAFAAIYFVWGSTFLAIRITIGHIPPLLMCGARLLSAGLVLVAWARATGQPWPRGIEWRNAALVGILLPGIGNSGVTLAETHVPSGLVALLVATIPAWLAVLSAMGPNGVRPSGLTLAGLVAGFAGIALLIGPGLLDARHATIAPGWALIPVGGAFTWAWGTLWSRRVATPSSPLMATGVGLTAGGVLALLAGAAAGEPARFDLAAVTPASLVALAYLSIMGSVVAFTAYLYLLRHVPPGLVATYAFVNPIVAMALGWAFAGEVAGPRTLLAAGMVIVSVVLIVASGARPHAAQSVTAIRATAEPAAVATRAK